VADLPGTTANSTTVGQRAPRSALFSWILMIVGLAAALALLRGGQELSARLPVDSLAAAILLFYIALFLPLALLSLVLGRLEGRPVMRAGVRPLRWGAIGLAVGVGGLAITAGYVWLNGTLRVAPPGEPVPSWFLAMGLAITVLQVGAEEMLFRGWLLSALELRLGPALAVVVSALAFSAFHLLGGASALLSLANLMLGGIWFALLAQRSGGILAPFLAHYGWNVAEDIGLGLVPNPGAGEFGSVADHDMVGVALWGGSQEGLNASIAMSVVLVALIVPLLPVFSRDRQPRPR
jgi:membrane protease YdiL (CAAX protease family)